MPVFVGAIVELWDAKEDKLSDATLLLAAEGVEVDCWLPTKAVDMLQALLISVDEREVLAPIKLSVLLVIGSEIPALLVT